jgi:hypothetical protein
MNAGATLAIRARGQGRAGLPKKVLESLFLPPRYYPQRSIWGVSFSDLWFPCQNTDGGLANGAAPSSLPGSLKRMWIRLDNLRFG